MFAVQMSARIPRGPFLETPPVLGKHTPQRLNTAGSLCEQSLTPEDWPGLTVEIRAQDSGTVDVITSGVCGREPNQIGQCDQ